MNRQAMITSKAITRSERPILLFIKNEGGERRKKINKREAVQLLLCGANFIMRERVTNDICLNADIFKEAFIFFEVRNL